MYFKICQCKFRSVNNRANIYLVQGRLGFDSGFFFFGYTCSHKDVFSCHQRSDLQTFFGLSQKISHIFSSSSASPIYQLTIFQKKAYVYTQGCRLGLGIAVGLQLFNMIVVAGTGNDFDTGTCPTWLNHIVHIQQVSEKSENKLVIMLREKLA